MSEIIAPDSTDQSVNIHVSDSVTFANKTDFNAATPNATLHYQRGDRGVLTPVPLTNLADLADAHTDGGIIHKVGGNYRVDLPDAAFASGVDEVFIFLNGDGSIQTGAHYRVRLSIDFAQRIDDMTQDPGNGIFRFTSAAVALAPTGLDAATVWHEGNVIAISNVPQTTNARFRITNSDGDYLYFPDLPTETYNTLAEITGDPSWGDVTASAALSGGVGRSNLFVDNPGLSPGSYTVLVTDSPIDDESTVQDNVIGSAEFSWDGATLKVAGSPSFDAEQISDKRTWFISDRGEGHRATNIVTVQDGFAGTLQFDYRNALESTLSGVPTVEVTGPTTIAATRVRLRMFDSKAVLFDMPGLTTTGTYTIKVTAQTVDSQAIPCEGTLTVV